MHPFPRPAISLFCPTTKSPIFTSRRERWSCHGRAFCYFAILPNICVRLPKYMSQSHVFYRIGIVPHTCDRPSTCTTPHRASGYLATLPCTDDRRSRHTPQNHWFCCPSSSPRNNCRPSKYIYPRRSSSPQHSSLHIDCHRPRSRCPCRAGNHRAISLHIWPHCNACMFRIRRPCRLSTPRRIHLRRHGWTCLSENKNTLSVGLAVRPLSLVFGTVRPDLNSIAPTNTAAPLTVINYSVFELHRVLLFNSVGVGRPLASLVQITEIFLIIFGETGPAEWMSKYYGLAASSTGLETLSSSRAASALMVSLGSVGFSQF